MSKLTLLMICALLASCASVGPKLVSGSRTDYNVVLRQADDQQMLLNLVRLRYRDQAMFLEVSALNTQFSISNEVNANTELGQGDSFLGLGGKVVAQETPTVSYTPLKGADFVQRVLTPISLDTLFLLNNSGWQRPGRQWPNSSAGSRLRGVQTPVIPATPVGFGRPVYRCHLQ
jgi:hypothetical protein